MAINIGRPKNINTFTDEELTARLPKGRPKGIKNKKTIIIENLLSCSEITEKLASGEIRSPLGFLLEIMNNPTENIGVRVDCAKAALKYTHKAMPVLTELMVNKTENPPTLLELYQVMDTKQPK